MPRLVALAILAFAPGCITPYELPKPKPDWRTVVQKLKPFESRGQQGDVVDVGNNVRVVGCGEYAGGLDLFLLDLEKSLQSGLQCLASQGPKGEKDASRLAALFDERIDQRPVTILCGVPGTTVGVNGSHEVRASAFAASFMPESDDFPGFIVNLDAAGSIMNHAERRSTLLHEMVHWLGYRHSMTFDMPYLAEACCFSRQPDNACQLIRDAPDFQGANYLKRLAVIGNQERYPKSVVIRAAMGAAVAKKDGALLMAVTGEVFGARFDPFLGSLYGAAAKYGVNERERPKISNALVAAGLDRSAYPAFTEPLGGLVGAVIQGDRDGARVQWTAVQTAASATCGRLSDIEREQLGIFIETTMLYVIDAEVLDLPALRAWSDLCGAGVYKEIFQK